jgi:hypothetical protein
MAWFLLGLGVLIVSLVAGASFARANPRRVALVLRNLGGAAALLLAAIFALRGLVVLAIPLGLAGAALLGLKLPFGMGGGNPFGGDARRSPGQRSAVSTSHLEMELEHDTGEMRGRIVAGRFAGRDLDDMRFEDVLALGAELSADDPQGLRLLEAWLDRRQPDWRERAGGEAPRPGNGRMTRAEALEVLGLKNGASEDEIKRAHRNLMKRMHPDQGGSTWLAARLNEAKDVLLG